MVNYSSDNFMNYPLEYIGIFVFLLSTVMVFITLETSIATGISVFMLLMCTFMYWTIRCLRTEQRCVIMTFLNLLFPIILAASLIYGATMMVK